VATRREGATPHAPPLPILSPCPDAVTQWSTPPPNILPSLVTALARGWASELTFAEIAIHVRCDTQHLLHYKLLILCCFQFILFSGLVSSLLQAFIVWLIDWLNGRYTANNRFVSIIMNSFKGAFERYTGFRRNMRGPASEKGPQNINANENGNEENWNSQNGTLILHTNKSHDEKQVREYY